MRSLTRQTVTIVLIAQVLCALGLAGAVTLREARAHLLTFDVRIQGHSDSLLGAIQDAEDPDSTVAVDPTELRLPEQDFFAVYNQGGKMLGSSANAPAPLIARGKDGFRTIRFHGERYRVLQRNALRIIDRAEFGPNGLQRPITILYASPENRVWHQIFESVSFSLFAIFLAAAVTVLCVSFFLRRALQPLTELASAASCISPPALEFAPPASILQVRELRPLADVLSEAVLRLREAFEKEQRFVGDAAHELKTAIAVVRSSIQLLMLKQRTPDEYASGLERILEDNVRVEDLVAQMLLLARLEEASSSDVTVELAIVVHAVLAQLQPIADEHHLQLRAGCASGTLVNISPERAQVLLSNLVLNAIQHSSPGSTVEVSVAHQDGTVLRVQDTGSGIAPESLPHIFERFYREDRSRSRNTGGTGLGLAICKSIVDAAGAAISITSQADSGTTVTVIFRPA